MTDQGESDEWFDPRQLEVIGPEEDEEDNEEFQSNTVPLDMTVGTSSWNNGHHSSSSNSNSKSQSMEVGYEAFEMVVEDVPMNGLIIEDFQLIVDQLPDVNNDMEQSTMTATSIHTEYELLMSCGLYLFIAFCVIRCCCCGWFRNLKRDHVRRSSSYGKKTSSSSSSSSSSSVLVQINDILIESKESLWYTHTYISSPQMISIMNDLQDCVHSLREKVREDCRVRDFDHDHDLHYHTNPGYSNKYHHDGPSESMLAEYKDLARRIDDMISDVNEVIEPFVMQEGFDGGSGRGLGQERNQLSRLGGYGGMYGVHCVLIYCHELQYYN